MSENSFAGVAHRRALWAAAAIAGALVMLLVAADRGAASVPGAGCRDADFLFEEGDLEGAQALYEHGLSDPNARHCALVGLQALEAVPDTPSETPDPCAGAQALADAGRRTQAVESYVSLIGTPAAQACARAGLGSIPPGPESSIASRIWSWVLRFGLVTLGLIVIAILAVRIRRPQLVVLKPEDSTASDELSDRAGGLGQRARELLARDLLARRRRYRQQRAKQNRRSALHDRAPVIPLPRGAIDMAASSMVAGLKDVPGVGSVVPLLSTLLRPRGVQVSSVFQIESSPRRFGISYEVSDIDGKEDARLFTVWRPVDGDLVTTYIGLLQPATRLLAIELLRRKEFLSAWDRWRLRKYP